jgi:hypothetical protein
VTGAGRSFDVPEWVASLAACPRADVSFTDQNESGQTLTTHYRCGPGLTATVELVALPLPGGRRGNWQLIARVGNQTAGAQMPASTRFSWH